MSRDRPTYSTYDTIPFPANSTKLFASSCSRPAAGAILQGLCCRSYAAGAMLLQGLCCCRGYAAGALLQGLCYRGYAAGAMLQGLCCRDYAALKVVGAQRGSVLNLGAFCCVLQRFGAVVLRYAAIGDRFAAFSISLVPFCYVLH